MYDTARRVAFVKQRVREDTRRGQRREAISLSAFCLMLFTALAGAADALIVQGQTAAPAHEQTRHPRRDAGNGRSGRGSLASSHAGTRLPIAYKTPDSGRSPSACDARSRFLSVAHRLSGLFARIRRCFPLQSTKDCCGKPPCLRAKILAIRRTPLTKTASKQKRRRLLRRLL